MAPNGASVISHSHLSWGSRADTLPLMPAGEMRATPREDATFLPANDGWRRALT